MAWFGTEVEGMKIYSTNEKVVGKWTDGATLYEKVTEFNIDASNLNSWKDYSLGITGTRMVSQSLIVQHQSNGSVYVSSGTSSTANLKHMYNIINGNVALYINSNDYVGMPVTCIVRYTKS